jgi:hypothetical protein
MKAPTILSLSLLSLAIVNPSFADDERAALEQLVADNHYLMQWDDSRATGPGLDWLVAEGAKSQYFLIGERHGLAQIPALSASIYAGLANNGYRHAALEIGPFAAIQVEARLDEGGYPTLENFLTTPAGYSSVAFLDWKEEAVMAADLYASSKNKQGFFWGLDQEFSQGLAAYLSYFEASAENDEQLAAIRDMRAALDADPRRFVNTLPSEMAEFADLFADHSSPEVTLLAEAIVESNTIYGAWAKPARIAKAEANVRREDYMKSNLIKLIRQTRKETGESPKVFFKFGGMHAAPSVDMLNGRITLGTFVEAIARADDQIAFNIFVECTSGGRKSSGQDKDGGTDDVRECNSFLGPTIADADADQERHLFSDVLSETDDMVVFDLRPLRLRMNEFKFLSDSDREVIASFDAYVVIPNVGESTSYELRNQ